MPPENTKQNPHTSVGGSIPSRATSSHEEESRDTPGQTLPIGTRVRFLKTLDEGPCDEHPGRLYARAGEFGTVVQGDFPCAEGHWVLWDGWKKSPFGAKLGEDFEGVTEAPTPEPWGFALWQNLHQEHGLTLVESELQEIVRLAEPLTKGAAFHRQLMEWWDHVKPSAQINENPFKGLLEKSKAKGAPGA